MVDELIRRYRPILLVVLPALAVIVVVAAVGIIVAMNPARNSAQGTPTATTAPGSPTASPSATLPPLPPGKDWMMYRGRVSGDGVSPETGVNAQSVAKFSKLWNHGRLPTMMSTPAVVGGVVYVTVKNSLLAYRLADGALLWQFDDAPQNFGYVSSSVAVDPSTGFAYYGTPDTYVYAVDTRTHTKVWAVQIGDPKKGAHIWSSPVLANGKVYIGLASNDDNPCVRGAVYAFDPASGTIAWTHYTEPAGRLGASVWSTVAANPAKHELLVTTGNPCPWGGTAYEEDSILALDWDSGKTLWQYQAIAYDNCDCDFGQGPVDLTYHGQEYVVAGSKLGYIYAVKPPAGRTGQPQLVWKRQISVTGYYIQGGIYQPPAYANGLVYVAGGPTPDGACKGGRLVAMHVDTGAVAWQTCTSGQVVSASAIVNGILFVAQENTVVGYRASDGKMLWKASFTGKVWGGISFSHGRLLVAVTHDGIICYGVPA